MGHHTAVSYLSDITTKEVLLSFVQRSVQLVWSPRPRSNDVVCAWLIQHDKTCTVVVGRGYLPRSAEPFVINTVSIDWMEIYAVGFMDLGSRFG